MSVRFRHRGRRQLPSAAFLTQQLPSKPAASLAGDKGLNLGYDGRAEHKIRRRGGLFPVPATNKQNVLGGFCSSAFPTSRGPRRIWQGAWERLFFLLGICECERVRLTNLFVSGKYLRQKRIDFQLPYDILWQWKHNQVQDKKLLACQDYDQES